MCSLKRLFGFVTFMVAVVFAPAAFAQCVYDGIDSFVCSGDSDGYLITGTAAAERFEFQDGVSGAIILHGGGAPISSTSPG